MQGADFSTAVWHKSSRSGNENAECVEVAVAGDAVGVRDSKDPRGGMLTLNRAQWRSFLALVKMLPAREGSARE